MICANCGFSNAAGDEFCGSCGNFLAWNEGQAPATKAAPPTFDPSVQPTSAPSGTATPRPTETPFAGDRTTGTTAAAPLPSAVVPPAPAQLVRCTVCGTANEVTRAFCMKCGSALPKSEAPAHVAAGTVSGAQVAAARADRKPTNLRPVAYLVGGLLIFLVFVVLAFLALGGLNGVANAPTRSPVGTLVAGGPTASANAAGASPSASTGAITTAVPGTDIPDPSPAASVPTSAAPSAPASAPAAGVSCDSKHFDATAPGGWRITSLSSSRTAQTDRLSVHMKPASASSTGAVDAVLMAPGDVQSTVGVPGPASGNVALVLSFNEAVALPFDTTLDAGYRALKEASLWRHAGRAYVVVGVNGSGCFDLASAGWSTGQAESTTLDVDIQR